MPEMNIFDDQETKLVCNTPDGQKIEIDLLDLDDLAIEVYAGRESLPVGTYLSEMSRKFAEKYGFKISKASMDILLGKKNDLLKELKKNSFPMQGTTSSMESNLEQEENTKS